MNTEIPIIHAYIDESGAKGLLRNLTLDRDNEIAVAAAVLIPEVQAANIHGQLNYPFNNLKLAMPPGEKLHITDAFSSTITTWKTAAENARREIERILTTNKLAICYVARRLGVSRRTFEMTQTTINSARDFQKASTPHICFSNHPSDDRVEGEVFSYLFQKLDAVGKCLSHHVVPHIDNTTDAIFKQYIKRLKAGRTLAQNTSVHHAYDTSKKQRVSGQIGFTVHLGDGNPATQFNTTHVRAPTVDLEVTPEILAADVVANSLLFHLSQLQAPLNLPSSISGWTLSSLVTAMVPNDNFDLL